MKLLTYLKNFMMLFYLLIFYVNSLRKELNTTLEKQEVHDGRQMYNHINLNKNSNITVVLSNKTLYDENSVIINKKFCDFKHLKQKFKHKILNDSRKDKMNFSENIYDPDPHLNITKPDSYNSSSIETVIFSEKSGSEHKINESISSDELLSIIADQTENIKNEICSSCLEIMTSLNILIDEIKLIKKTLHDLTVAKPPIFDVYTKILHCINNLNLIKADLFKLNEILDTLQKANCSNFIENSKKYTLVVNSSNKLLEKIQDCLKTFNININLLVLN